MLCKVQLPIPGTLSLRLNLVITTSPLAPKGAKYISYIHLEAQVESMNLPGAVLCIVKVIARGFAAADGAT